MITCIYYHDGWESERGIQCTNTVIAGSTLHYGFELCIESLFNTGNVYLSGSFSRYLLIRYNGNSDYLVECDSSGLRQMCSRCPN